MASHCKLLVLDITGNKQEEAAQDPALASMWADGWSVQAYWFSEITSETGELQGQRMNLLMAPPRDSLVIQAQRETSYPDYMYRNSALIAVAVTLVALIAYRML